MKILFLLMVTLSAAASSIGDKCPLFDLIKTNTTETSSIRITDYSSYQKLEKSYRELDQEKLVELANTLLDQIQKNKQLQNIENEHRELMIHLYQVIKILLDKNEIKTRYLGTSAKDFFNPLMNRKSIYLRTVLEWKQEEIQKKSPILGQLWKRLDVKGSKIDIDGLATKKKLVAPSEFVSDLDNITLGQALKVFGLENLNEIRGHIDLAELFYNLEISIEESFDDIDTAVREAQILYRSFHKIAQSDSDRLFDNMLIDYMKMDISELKEYIKHDILIRLKYNLPSGLDRILFINRTVVLQYVLFVRNNFSVKLVNQNLTKFSKDTYTTEMLALQILPRENSKNYFERFLARLAKKLEVKYITISPHDLSEFRAYAYIYLNPNVNEIQVDIGDYDIFRFFTEKSSAFDEIKGKTGNISYTARHEWTHVFFVEKRDSGIESIFHPQFYAIDSKLNDFGMYDDYISIEELYTHARNPFWMSDELLDTHIRSGKELGWLLSDISRTLQKTHQVGLTVNELMSELLRDLNLIKSFGPEADYNIFDLKEGPARIKGEKIIKGHYYLHFEYSGKLVKIPIIGPASLKLVTKYYESLKEYEIIRKNAIRSKMPSYSIEILLDEMKNEIKTNRDQMVDYFISNFKKLESVAKSVIIESSKLEDQSVALSEKILHTDIEKRDGLLRAFRRSLRDLANSVNEGHKDFAGNKKRIEE